jgi:protein SCO1/2
LRKFTDSEDFPKIRGPAARAEIVAALEERRVSRFFSFRVCLYNEVMRAVRIFFFILLALFSFTLVGCSRKPAAPERQYDLSGKIIAVDRKAHELTIQHEDIPGLMKGMTMPFRVKDDWVFGTAQPGDNVSATLIIAGDSSHLENVVVTKGSGVAPNEAGIRLPQIGDAVPDFTFIDQDGKKVRLTQLRGKAVLLTFIYTRCPLPDYCIRMSNNFNAIAKQLKQQPALYDKTEQLSISFDPEYDKPKVLRDYGENYASEVDPKFTHWKFVTATPAEIKRAGDFFGLSYTPNGAQIVHSLRTVVIGPDGKIVHLFNGNEWKPTEAVQVLTDSVK